MCSVWKHDSKSMTITRKRNLSAIHDDEFVQFSLLLPNEIWLQIEIVFFGEEKIQGVVLDNLIFLRSECHRYVRMRSFFSQEGNNSIQKQTPQQVGINTSVIICFPKSTLSVTRIFVTFAFKKWTLSFNASPFDFTCLTLFLLCLSTSRRALCCA